MGNRAWTKFMCNMRNIRNLEFMVWVFPEMCNMRNIRNLEFMVWVFYGNV